MANDRVQQQLVKLKGLRAEGPSAGALKELKTGLADRVNVIVAKAAAIAAEWQARTLVPDLVKAFDRLMLKGGEGDPQCSGKAALAVALKDLGFSESAVFLRGLRHRQMESTWGGKTDTAGALRGICALALVQCLDIPRDETLACLLDALTDVEARVRTEGARALQQMGGREVVLLFRLKARLGDEDARVTGQVMEAILDLEQGVGVAFVAGFLEDADDEVSEEAALALGASRLPAAIDVLKETWKAWEGRRNGDALLRALSASRQDSALDFLYEQIRQGRLRTAQQALRMLDLHRDSEAIVQRAAEAAAEREELRALFHEVFPGYVQS